MNVVDLFCGCGGMSLGFQNADNNVLVGFDNWKPAIDLYKLNFDHPIMEMDIFSDAVIPVIAGYQPDMIIGGPPCQDFSIAGARQMGKRANLTVRFAEIVKAIRPEWFVMENVYNIERMPILPQAIKIFKEAGYGITTEVLDASRCGCPQTRKRFFAIGHLGDADGFLSERLRNGLSEHSMTVREYWRDTLGKELDAEFYYMHPRSYNRRAVFSIDEPSATIRGVNRPIPSDYKKHHADKADIKDGVVRALTTKERSYIQTFPEEYKLVGNKTNVEQAIGNAVPVNLATYVANIIRAYSETL